MVKHIIFDFGGVIIKLDPEEAIRRFEELGIADARQQLNIYGQTGIFKQLETGDLTADEFLHRLALEAQSKGGKFPGEPSPVFPYADGEWAWMSYVKELPEKVLENLLQLRQRYTLSLLSNLNPFIAGWAESERFDDQGHSLAHYLHHRFYSYQLHDYKPAASIFEATLQRLGACADECVFLDDSPRNVEAACAVGMHGLLVEKDEDWSGKLTALLEKI